MKTQRLLKGLFSLDHNVRLYIPSTINVNGKIDTSKHVNEALELLGRLFGGATEFKALGAWVSKDKGLITEKVTIVEAYASTEAIEKGLPAVLEYGTALKQTLKQEAIALEYDNKMYFL